MNILYNYNIYNKHIILSSAFFYFDIRDGDFNIIVSNKESRIGRCRINLTRPYSNKLDMKINLLLLLLLLF
jgi:hypothetical protein